MKRSISNMWWLHVLIIYRESIPVAELRNNMMSAFGEDLREWMGEVARTRENILCEKSHLPFSRESQKLTGRTTTTYDVNFDKMTAIASMRQL